MMFLRMIGMLLAFFGIMASGIASVLMGSRELDEVNRLLPPERRFGWLGWNPGKSLDFQRESWRLGVRARYRWRRTWLGIAFLCSLVAFGWLIP